MAFTPATFSLSVDTISGGSLRIHFYTTPDSQAAVLGTGYFTSIADRGVRLNDLVIVRSAASGTFLAEFTTIDAAGNGSVQIEETDVAMPINAKTTAYSVVNEDRLSTLALGGTSFYTATYGAPTSYAANFQNWVTNTDAVRAKFINLNGTTYRLDPGQTVRVFRDGSSWRIDLPDRRTIRNNTTVYVATTGSDTLNDGLSAASPFATIQKGIDYAYSLDHGAFTTTVRVADGTYVIADGATAARFYGSITGNVIILLEGNLAAPENVIVELGNGCTGFDAKDYGCGVVQGFTLKGGAGKSGIVGLRAHQTGILDFQAMYFGAMPNGLHLQIMKGGHATAVGGYAISGSARAHLSITDGGRFEYVGATTASITEDVTWDLAFVNITEGGYMRMPSSKAFGIAGGKTATGPRWRADDTAMVSFEGRTLEFMTANAGSTAGAKVDSGIGLSGPFLVSSGGLKFPVTDIPSTDANTLDDYQEVTTSPTVTSGSGTFTSVAATLRTTKIGRVVTVSGLVAIVTNGTAAGSIVVPLPFTCGAWGSPVAGMRIDAGNIAAISGYVPANNAALVLYKPDGTYPGANGAQLMFEVTYQV